jgi:UDP-2,3-diacylglucosamine pyrophosphatase LpxH
VPNTLGSMGKCFFVSDLHLFANRSKAWKYLDEMILAAGRADDFVFGGDIFDFRWARTKNHRHTVELAIDWLADLATDCPNCHFHFVLGNHDYHHEFIDRLAGLSTKFKNFTWYRYYVRLGNSVFLHGDVADDEHHTAETLAADRQEWLYARRRGKFMSRLYDVVVLTRLHKPFPHLVYSKRIVARRILAYLRRISQGPLDGVKNVYFGHIHKHMTDYAYGGLIFHSGGAPIKGLKFRILEAVTD